jgi:GTPase SAR1 family protein
LTALVVAYSITSLRSLEAAQDILNILEDMNIDKQVFLVGLKSDLQDHRVVSFATGEELARKYGTFFQELSSFNSMQVQEFFRHIAELLPVQKVSSVGDKGKL